MCKQKLQVAVELLTGHKTLDHLCLNSNSHSDRTANRAETKEKILYNIVYQYLVLACKRYRTLECVFLKPKDLENMKVNGLISLVANPRIGSIPYTHFKINSEKVKWNYSDLHVIRDHNGNNHSFSTTTSTTAAAAVTICFGCYCATAIATEICR